MIWVIEDVANHICLFFTSGDESDSGSMIDDWIGKGDAVGWGFGGVLEISDPAILFCEKLVTGEERGGVAVGTHAEEDKIEDGEAGCVLLCEFLDELLLIRVGEFLEVGEEIGVDSVYVGGGDRDV